MIRESRERYVSDCGCRVTALPLYSEQLAFAEKRLRRRNSNQDWNLLLQDYRDVDGRFDRIVAIEWRRRFQARLKRSTEDHAKRPWHAAVRV